MKKLLFVLPLAALLMIGCNNSNKGGASGSGEEQSGQQSEQGGESGGSSITLDLVSSLRTAGTNQYIWQKDGFKVTNGIGECAADQFSASIKDDHARFYAATSLKFEYSKPIKKMVLKCWVWSGKNGASILAEQTWSVGSAVAGSEYTKTGTEYIRCDATWTYDAGAASVEIAKLSAQTRVEQIIMTY